MAVVLDASQAVSQRPAQDKVRDDSRFVPDPENSRPNTFKEFSRFLFKLQQQRLKHRPRRMRKGPKGTFVMRIHRSHRLGDGARQRQQRCYRFIGQPTIRQPAGIFRGGCIHPQLFVRDFRIVGPGHVETTWPEPILNVNWCTKETVIVEIKITLGKSGNAVNIRLYIAGVEGRQ